MNSIVLLKNANVFDGAGAELAEGVDIVVEEGRIVEVGPRLRADTEVVIDVGGRTLLPGLIDAHVHVYAVELDLTRAMRRPFSYTAHHASRFLRHMLEGGFTSVRDVGGADGGLAQALNDGLIRGPRLFYGGRLLSQTGGHGDWRPGHEHDPSIPCACGLIDQRTAVLADGVDEVLKATREELRRGAHHIKIMASGGVASPSDSISALQYSPEEITAVVGETTRHGSYVAAHCHPAEAIRLCAELGVRSIEHGTMIDAETARIVKTAGAFVVPTMAIIAGLAAEGPALGLPAASQAKLLEIVGRATESLAILRAAEIPVGFGTDLLGPLYTRNLSEFDLRREVFTPLEILRSATSVNARLLKAEGRIGCVAPGAYADMIVVDGNPLQDISIMTRGPAAMPLVMRGGEIIRNALP